LGTLIKNDDNISINTTYVNTSIFLRHNGQPLDQWFPTLVSLKDSRVAANLKSFLLVKSLKCHEEFHQIVNLQSKGAAKQKKRLGNTTLDYKGNPSAPIRRPQNITTSGQINQYYIYI